MSKVLEITTKNFKEEVLGDKGIVMLDCYAQWCGPCKMMHATIEEISQEYSDKIKVCKADIEQCSNITSDYEITAVPAVLFFKDGKMVKKVIGLQAKSSLEEEIEGVKSNE